MSTSAAGLRIGSRGRDRGGNSHTRLIAAYAGNQRTFADELNGQNASRAMTGLYYRQGEALRQFGLDPIHGPADEVARAVAASRIRDALLGILLDWQYHTDYRLQRLQRYPERKSDFPETAPVVRDRLGQVVRSARKLCGGAYARW